MVAGGFKNDLLALDDETHDGRYVRLVEYTQIVPRAAPGGAGHVRGQVLQVRTWRITPPVPEEL